MIRLAVLLALSCLSAFAQRTYYEIIGKGRVDFSDASKTLPYKLVTVAPTGSCPDVGEWRQNSVNGKLYYCPTAGGVWIEFVGSGGGGGGVGPAGPTGPTGPSGTAATISIGQVTTGAAGTQASVTNVGTATNAILEMVFPRGDPGTGGGGGGGGAGDVIGPATSANNTLPLFATDKTLKNATVSGIPLLTSGVLTIAVAGTNYQAPLGFTPEQQITFSSIFARTVNAISLSSQAANTVIAAPNGSAGVPTARLLVAADIPNLDAAKITTGSVSPALIPGPTTTLRGGVLQGACNPTTEKITSFLSSGAPVCSPDQVGSGGSGGTGGGISAIEGFVSNGTTATASGTFFPELGGNNVYAPGSNNDFGASQFLKLKTGSTLPVSTECNISTSAGRVYFQYGNTPGTLNRMWVCSQDVSASTFSWHVASSF